MLTYIPRGWDSQKQQQQEQISVLHWCKKNRENHNPQIFPPGDPLLLHAGLLQTSAQNEREAIYKRIIRVRSCLLYCHRNTSSLRLFIISDTMIAKVILVEYCLIHGKKNNDSL